MRYISLLAAATLCLAAGLESARADAGPAPGRITVSAEGRVEAVPDMASVSIGVVTDAATAAEALRTNSARLAAVLERLKAAGIEDRDLQTSGLSLSPQYDYSRDNRPPRLIGYQVTNMLGVRVRDLALVGRVLDEAVGDGANSFNGLSFAVAEPGPLMDTARTRAVAEARRRAEMMAGAAGVGLGRVLEISESGGMRPMRGAMFAPMAEGAIADAVPIAEGEVTYSVTVTMVWEIAQP